MKHGARSQQAQRARRSWCLALLLLLPPVLGLAAHLPGRLDLTEESLYSLSPATLETLAKLDDRLQVKLYFNRDIEGAEALLPERLVMEDLLFEIAKAGAPYVSVETVDPTTDLVAQRDAEHIGIQPIPLSGQDLGGVSVELIYQGLELRYQDRSEVIPLVIAPEFEFAFTVRLASLLRGSRPVIGIVSDEPPLPPQIPGVTSQVPPARIYEELRQTLAERYTVRDINPAKEGDLSNDLVTVLVARPWALAPEKLQALDRYLAEGGHMVVLQESEQIDVVSLQAMPGPTGMEEWLAGFGVRVESDMVFDDSAIEVPAGVRQVQTPQGMQTVPIQARYGFAPIVQDGLNPDHIVTASLAPVTLFWAHPITLEQVPSGLVAETLISSGRQSWLLPASKPLDMNVRNLESLRAEALASGEPQARPLVVALRGVFPPQFSHENLEPAPGLLTVLGDADLWHNATLRVADGANQALAMNLFDWSAQDESLIQLRSRGKKERPLPAFAADYVVAQGGWSGDPDSDRELDRAAKAHARGQERWISWGNVLVPIGIVLILALAHRRFHGRRARKPYLPYGKGGNS